MAASVKTLLIRLLSVLTTLGILLPMLVSEHTQMPAYTPGQHRCVDMGAENAVSIRIV